MTTKEAANRGVSVYQSAIKRGVDPVEAYIRGLDFIIDRIFHDPEMEEETIKAVRAYERATA